MNIIFKGDSAPQPLGKNNHNLKIIPTIVINGATCLFNALFTCKITATWFNAPINGGGRNMATGLNTSESQDITKPSASYGVALRQIVLIAPVYQCAGAFWLT